MKQLLSRLLALVGLAPARSHRAALAQLAEMESKARRQAKSIEELKAASQTWKAKAGEALTRVKTLEAELKRLTKLAEKSSTALDRAEQRGVETLKKRLIDAERQLVLAREHLMATEVKLDILEGAANVLDVRMRTVLSRQPGQTGVSV